MLVLPKLGALAARFPWAIYGHSAQHIPFVQLAVDGLENLHWVDACDGQPGQRTSGSPLPLLHCGEGQEVPGLCRHVLPVSSHLLLCARGISNLIGLVAFIFCWLTGDGPARGVAVCSQGDARYPIEYREATPGECCEHFLRTCCIYCFPIVEGTSAVNSWEYSKQRHWRGADVSFSRSCCAECVYARVRARTAHISQQSFTGCAGTGPCAILTQPHQFPISVVGRQCSVRNFTCQVRSAVFLRAGVPGADLIQIVLS
mmetsp:Transcript_5022/g.8756  ORF Transcript_5022/g.8756 Transcript_5022/m.8756 type:complete len:258 (-) Transcript_5022:284-1057(-)